MSGELKRVAIVIPVYNRRETTLQGLRSLHRLETAGVEIKIFIVDDASTDGTAEAIRREFPDVKVIPGDGTLHYAGGTNLGIAAALGWGPDFVITANDDSVFHPLFLKRMIDAAEAHPRSVIGALLLLWDEPHRVFQVGFEWNTWAGGWNAPDDLTAFSVPQSAFEVDGMAGNCLLIPVAAINECGMLDAKRFPFGWGDMQYTRRLKSAGWRLLVEPKAYVWCEPNTYPRPLHTERFSRALAILFRDRRHPLNLHRQFVARWFSAPSGLKAIAAFGAFLMTIAGKTFTFGMRRRRTLDA